MSQIEQADALVIGAGPAGLMAAAELLQSGRRVILAEAKPSAGRKLLMAGKSGLNLTKNESPDQFIKAYGEAAPYLAPMIAEFGPRAVSAWAESLGQGVFVGSSGRVFPISMKASPLLRAWLKHLTAQGLMLRMRWRWLGLSNDAVNPAMRFATPQGEHSLSARCTVLALGGASWSRLGSDGLWSRILCDKGVDLAPFQPANMGFNVAWSAHMAAHFGAPLKAIDLVAGPYRAHGEIIISRHGIEGGGIYAVSRAIREGHGLTLDLFPGRDIADLTERLRGRPARESLTNRLRKALGLTGARLAVVLEFMQPTPTDLATIAAHLKALPVRLQGPRPLDEAISVAGGIRWEGLDGNLMIKALPGVFAAGEMLDWEAPTGGYLLTACLATGRWAGRAAARCSEDANPGRDYAT
ncbi:MAG: TIGR03862 family flavoprotein [Pararhodobacter sp.]